MFIQKIIARIFNTAASIKKGVAEPVNDIMYGKANAVKNDPRFPAIFIVPLTAPEFSLPISTQVDHDGLKVISAPKTAIEIKHIAPITSLIKRLITIPVAARLKPMIAGSFLDKVHFPFLYIRSTSQPENQLPKAPKSSGAEE